MEIETLLNQRYVIKEVLGRGGFAITHLALDSKTQQTCAIKCLSFRKIEKWKTLELFERETKVLKALNHKQIPKYLDSFSVETEDGLQLYLVQEYVEGKSLAQLVKEGKHFTEQEIIGIGLEVTNVLVYLQNLSPPIIHRDIKPSNIIISSDNQRVFLIDFGAVRERMIADDTTIGGGSTIVGTYGYMPIEQFQGRALPASDIYSLGVTLISLLTRKEPFEIEHKGQALNYRPYTKISRSFSIVLDTMIDSNHKKRYQTAEKVKRDLEKLKAGKRIVAVKTPVKLLAAAVILLALMIWGGLSLWISLVPQSQLQTTPMPIPQSKSASITALEALLQKSRALFLSHDELGALLEGVKAGKALKQSHVPVPLKNQILFNIREIVNNIHEINRLGGEFPINSIALSPDGKVLASGDQDGNVHLWNVADGRKILTLQEKLPYIRSVTFSPDGTILAASNAVAPIKLWNVADGREILSLGESPNAGANCLAFSPNGQLLASGDAEGMHIWDLSNGRKIIRLEDWTEIFSVAFSPDGKLVIAGGKAHHLTDMSNKGIIFRWKVGEWKNVSSRYHGMQVNSITFSPDGSLFASGSTDKTIKLWSTLERKEIATLQGHAKSVQSVAFSQDGTMLASASTDHTIKVWNDINQVSKGSDIIQPITLEGHSDSVEHVVFSSDGALLASGSWDKTIRLWRFFDMSDQHALQGHSREVESVAFHPKGILLASGSRDNTIKLWKIDEGIELNTLKGHSGSVQSVVFSPDGKLIASGSKDTTVKLWKVADTSEFLSLQGHVNEVNSVAFSPDGTLLASSESGNTRIVKLWNVSDGREIRTFQGAKENIEAIAFSPDGVLLAASLGDGFILWKVSNGKILTSIESSDDSNQSLWSWVRSVAFSPDGNLLAAGKMNAIKLWRLPDFREFLILQARYSGVESLVFSPDGSILAASMNDYPKSPSAIKLWNIADGSELTSFQTGDDFVYGLAFSPDGKRFAAGVQKSVKLWNLDMDDLLLQGCTWLSGYLQNNSNVSEEDRRVCDGILNGISEGKE